LPWGEPGASFAGAYQSLGFVPVEGVREGLLHGEPMPMLLPVDAIASAIED
jgi:hypothetical protein